MVSYYCVRCDAWHEKTSQFNYNVDTVNKFHNYGWLVSTDIKPSCGFLVSSEGECADAVDYLTTFFPGLKVHRRDIAADDIHLHVYKYDHISVVLDAIFKMAVESALTDVLNGYIYGIPPNMIEDYLQRTCGHEHK